MKKLESISYTRRKREYFKKGRSGQQCQMFLRCHGGEDWKNALLGFSQLKVNTNLFKRTCFRAVKGLAMWGCQCERWRNPYLLTCPSIQDPAKLAYLLSSKDGSCPFTESYCPSTPLPPILWPFLLLHLPFLPRVAPFLGSALLSEVELGALLLCFQGALCIFTITVTHTNWKCNHLSAVLSLLPGCELL